MEKGITGTRNYYIMASGQFASVDHKTLKHENSFAIFDSLGDIRCIMPRSKGTEGIYHRGTRYVSHYELYISSYKPLLLSSSVKEDNSLFSVDMTNPDIEENGRVVLSKGSVHIQRSKFLCNNSCYEKIHLQNFSQKEVELEISLLFEADFADIFEVRGARRKNRGIKLPPSVGTDEVIVIYRGVDGIVRKTLIKFSPVPAAISTNQAIFTFKLAPKQKSSILVTFVFDPQHDNASREILSFKQALFKTKTSLNRWVETSTAIYTSNEQFNQWLQRSYADIAMLMTRTPYGDYPYAGIPWYTTIFGRDGIITAYETLWINPQIARGTLLTLSALQANYFDEKEDAQPGKIVHEIREGEMANTGEIPFKRYYGSIDATPLFIILASAYYDRTGDYKLIKEIWPNIKKAMNWLERYADIDSDGLIEYVPCKNGLINKGWKDSADSVFHADGTPAEAPIALVEVQGYAYRAKVEASRLAAMLNEHELAAHWRMEAQKTYELIDRFYMEQEGFYAIALDGKKRQCKIKTSNAGHLLFAKAVDPKKARIIAQTLFDKEFFSGWGIRTLANTQARYNPLSYHNGSVWPHDNAIIAAGLGAYGLKQYTLKILKGLFDASTFFDLNRLPELFCGFARRPHEGPTHYPVACHPQAWSSAAVFLLLQAALGISFHKNSLIFRYPMLPEFLDEVWIKNLTINGARVDLYLKRYQHDVVINVARKEGEVSIVIEK